MCDLFGLSCSEEDRATKCLARFAELSKNNYDGWGIAYYKGNRSDISKEPKRALDSKAFFEAVEKTKSNIIIAHTRLKTNGVACQKNCHPFQRSSQNKDWIFAHNGSIPNIIRHRCSKGETDSEQIFHFILDQIEEYKNQGQIRGSYPGLIRGIKKVFEKYRKDINLNLLISDGTILYAFGHHKRNKMYFLKREKYYGGVILISTKKLSNENWKILPPNRLLLINRGDFLVLSDPLLSKYSKNY